MKSIFYNCLFNDVDFNEPTDKIIYSYLVYKSFLSIDEVFSSDGESFEYDIVQEYLEDNSETGIYKFSYSKAAKDLRMSVNTIKSRIKVLIDLDYLRFEDDYLMIYITDAIKNSFYFELQLQEDLKGESLIVYSYLKHKAEGYRGVITTYDKVQASEFGISKKHFQKILCQLYSLGLAERLPNGRLQIN